MEKKIFQMTPITQKLPPSGEKHTYFKHKYLTNLSLNFNEIFTQCF